MCSEASRYEAPNLRMKGMKLAVYVFVLRVSSVRGWCGLVFVRNPSPWPLEQPRRRPGVSRRYASHISILSLANAADIHGHTRNFMDSWGWTERNARGGVLWRLEFCPDVRMRR